MELNNFNINLTENNCINCLRDFQSNYKKFVDNQNKTDKVYIILFISLMYKLYFQVEDENLLDLTKKWMEFFKKKINDLFDER